MFTFRFLKDGADDVTVFNTEKQHLLLKGDAAELVENCDITVVDKNKDFVDEIYGADFGSGKHAGYTADDTILLGIYDEDDITDDVMDAILKTLGHCILYGDAVDQLADSVKDKCQVAETI